MDTIHDFYPPPLRDKTEAKPIPKDYTPDATAFFPHSRKRKRSRKAVFSPAPSTSFPVSMHDADGFKIPFLPSVSNCASTKTEETFNLPTPPVEEEQTPPQTSFEETTPPPEEPTSNVEQTHYQNINKHFLIKCPWDILFL
ncbi:unnamed protein product [Larinioides sclopetarius]|uniref:Uncharacterized protein n=1 Tax=Larinioides sclopetarius TaxID=280406 RepID=A0AAV2AQU1_9ARAC